MERKLATVQTITALEPIENADLIEKATVMGWSVVVQKGLHNVGDKCIFCEIDSLLPSEAEWSQFMRPRNFRVKTIKLRGCLSQGLILPLSTLGPITSEDKLQTVFEVGEDVSEVLGITKYEPPLPEDQSILGVFPRQVPKTDEIRLQSILEILDEIKELELVATVKLDGSSGTFYMKNGKLAVCSRNWEIKDGNNKYWNMARKYELENVLPEGFVVQGEICGPGIQKNRLGLTNVDLFIFNVYNTSTKKYLDYQNMLQFCSDKGLKTVPIAYENLVGDKLTLQKLLEMAEGKYESGKRREGIVLRPYLERHSTVLEGRMSFKVISNSFLLKDEE